MRKCLLLLVISITIIACNSVPTPSPTHPEETAESGLLPLPTAQPVPPTFTPSAEEDASIPTPLPTSPPQPTEIPATPIPFDDVVVTARLRIPAISYDRRLEGNIGSELIIVDESAARGQFRERQALILIELQQVLEDLVLAPVPEGCDQCVELEVTFPLEEIEYRGWLQDPILLASLENLFAVSLGAHFSPEAVAGLRRSASPYAPAQTIEIQQDGTVHIWQANKDAIVTTFEGSEALNTAVSETANTAFQPQYAASCEGVPLETLFLKSDLGGEQTVTIACPAFAVPIPMHDLYIQFDALMAEFVLDAIPPPDTGVPLTAVLQYQREDGAFLIIENDGALSLDDGSGAVLTDTVTLDQIGLLTEPLIESGTVSLGLSTFIIEDEAEKTAVLLIRGPQGLYDGAWSETQSITELAPLNDFVDSYLGITEEAPVEEDSIQTPDPEESTSTPESATSTPSP